MKRAKGAFLFLSGTPVFGTCSMCSCSTTGAFPLATGLGFGASTTTVILDASGSGPGTCSLNHLKRYRGVSNGANKGLELSLWNPPSTRTCQNPWGIASGSRSRRKSLQTE